jgi:hypothetical protein
MRALLNICVTVPKTFKSTYVSLDITLMCHPFEIQNIFKICAGAYPSVLLHHLVKMLKKHPHHQQRKLKRNFIDYWKGRMKKNLRVTQKYLKEGIMVNKSPRGRIHFQEDHLL